MHRSTAPSRPSLFRGACLVVAFLSSTGAWAQMGGHMMGDGAERNQATRTAPAGDCGKRGMGMTVDGMMGNGMMGNGMMGNGMMGNGMMGNGMMGNGMMGGGMMGRGMMGGGMMGGGMMGGGMMGKGMMNPLVRFYALDLKPEQEEGLDRIRRELRRTNWPLLGRLLDVREDLSRIEAELPVDVKAASRALGELYDIRKQMQVNRLKAINDAWKLLDDEQKKRLEGGAGHPMPMMKQ